MGAAMALVARNAGHVQRFLYPGMKMRAPVFYRAMVRVRASTSPV
jgi:hypothetical protein